MIIQVVSTTHLALNTDWIPIEERVPHNNYDVLFLIKNTRTNISRCRISSYSIVSHILNEYELVTHWKEIPY